MEKEGLFQTERAHQEMASVTVKQLKRLWDLCQSFC